MADDFNEIRISITLDDGSVREGFARIKKEGDDTGKGLSDSFEKARNQLLAFIGAYVGFEAAKKFVEQSIDASEKYEVALNNMNKALSSAGTYSAEASRGFVELSEQIEHTTTVSATQALSLEALARNYAANNEQAKQLTKAAIDLAAATGKDANTALQQLGGTLDGTAGRLGKLVPGIRSLTEYQLRMGDAIALTAARFKGSAAEDTNTYEGAIKRLQNSFETLRISIGGFITGSPQVRAAIQFISSEIQRLATYLKTFTGDQNFMRQFALDALVFGQNFNGAVIKPIEVFYNIAKISIDGVKELFQGLMMSMARAAQQIVSTFSPGSALAKNLELFADSSEEVFNKFQKQTSDDLAKIGDTKFTDNIANELTNLQTVVAAAKPFDPLRKDMDDTNVAMRDMSGEITSLGQSWRMFAAGARGELSLLQMDAVKKTQEIGKAFIDGLGNGVGNAFAMMGKAMAKGQNMLAAFGQAMLAAFGQALIQMGTGYIALGLARVIASYGADGTGWGLITQGGVLAALGGALTVFGQSSGSSGASANTSVGGGSASSAAIPDVNPAQAVTPQQQKTVTVNVHGSVFDTKETGLRLVELVNDAFSTQGAQVLVK